jgi:hypothetical protein
MGMNPEVKELWVKALESGEYKQGRAVLARVQPDGSETYCCLGVLTQEAVKAGITQRCGTDEYDVVLYGDALAPNTALPGTEVVEWAGLRDSDPNPYVFYNGSSYALSALNDSLGLNFKQIAALIREQL